MEEDSLQTPSDVSMPPFLVQSCGEAYLYHTHNGEIITMPTKNLHVFPSIILIMCIS
jgi:hypothetical protein